MKKIFLTFLILTAIVFGGLIVNNESQVAIAECHPPFIGPCEEVGPPLPPSNYCPPGEICNPLGSDTFEELLDVITYWLFVFSIPIVSIMILYGGFKMLIAAGNPTKIEAGKQTIIWSIVGFIVIILARGAALIIKDILGV